MINLVVDQYVSGHYTRDELETYLVNLGLYRQIVEVHLMQADWKKWRAEHATKILRAPELVEDGDNSQENCNPF